MNSTAFAALQQENSNLQSQLLSYQSELNTYQQRCEQYAQAYDQLKQQVQELLRNRFGKKSERFIDPESPQLSLLDDANKFTLADTQGEEAGIIIAEHSRKKKNNKIEKELPRRIEIIAVVELAKQLFAMKPKNY